MKAILIAAQLNSGKDVLADYLAKRLNSRTPDDWKRIGFAHAVKKVYMDAFNKTWDFVEEWKRKEESPPGMNMNVRKGLQFIGDGFRQIQGNIWIEIAFRDKQPKIISDGRYMNEVTYVRQNNGISILLWRPGFENNDPNKSEAEIKPVVDWFRDMGIEGAGWRQQLCLVGNNEPLVPVHPHADLFDIFIRNEGTVDDLYRKVDNIIVPYVEKKFYSQEEDDLAMSELKWITK